MTRLKLPSSARKRRAPSAIPKLTADLPGEPLFETIPNFHNTTSRLAALKEAIQSDPLGRVKEVQKEIDWYLSRESDCHLVVDYLKSGELPCAVRTMIPS